ncbi:MAG: TetR family transcriptional regulator [Aliifodinibius sp.]|nr:TetR/AcrR family transcriptional regulator [Fodinibius sp.]NIV15866.1 TetR family transcriptional regulator [Fodinibius sp.]NIY24619.1 TetR family transcriptional regulator [Fodinibius sp.]
MPDENEKIFAAALDEFAEVGLAESSIESIARRAELEPGSVRALFVDKETLLRKLLIEKTDPMISAIALAVDEIEDPHELLRKSLQLYDQWLMAHPKVVRLFLRCTLNDAASLKSLYQYSLLPSELFERLEDLIENRELRCKDLFILSVLIDSLILFPHMMRSAMELMNPSKTADQILETRLQAIFDLIENGLFSKPPVNDIN